MRVRLGDESTTDRALVRFEVADTGIGIDPTADAHLFDPFTQADASTTRRFGDTGLGLAIYQRLTEAMGGTIAFESQPGKGTTFWVHLPFGHASQPVGPPGPAAGAAYDAVLVDMTMPGMDGLQLGRVIRANAELGSLRLLLLSSISVEAEAAAEAGFTAQLQAGATLPPLRRSRRRWRR